MDVALTVMEESGVRCVFCEHSAAVSCAAPWLHCVLTSRACASLQGEHDAYDAGGAGGGGEVRTLL